METIDDEVTAGAIKFMDKSVEDKKAILRLVELHPHARLHAPEAESQGKTGFGVYADGMVEHDGQVGELLDELEELGSRQQHDRYVFHRQRRRIFQLAGRRHHAAIVARRTRNGKAATAFLRSSRWPGVIKPGRNRQRLFRP